MRTPEEMINLVLKTAKEDESIRAVTMCGSRANKDCPPDVYQATYSDADYDNMWKGAFEMLYLFGEVARMVAAELEFTYDEGEEKGIEGYMELVKAGKRREF